ncbi:hypothetical protein ABFV05_020202 [Capra hircus]
MIELSRLKEDLQDPGKAQGPVEAQLFGAEAGEAASPSASSPTVSCSALAEALPQEALNEMVANLVKFFLLKYLPKQLTSQAEMLKALRDNQEHFPVVFTQASECLQVVVGMEMKELDLRCEDRAMASDRLSIRLVSWSRKCLRGMWNLSSLARDRTLFPAAEARSLNHWTTKEVPLPGGDVETER